MRSALRTNSAAREELPVVVKPVDSDLVACLLEVGQHRWVERVPLGHEIPDGAKSCGLLEATEGVVPNSLASLDVVAEDDAVARSTRPEAEHRNTSATCGRHGGAHHGRAQIVECRVDGPGWEPRACLRSRQSAAQSELVSAWDRRSSEVVDPAAERCRA